MRPQQVHLQFGADAAREMTVSWTTSGPCRQATVQIGRADHGNAHWTVAAVERSYVEALTGQTVWTYHAPAAGLEPDTSYVYRVRADGEPGPWSTFRTGPDGRSGRFRFTSFGDLAVPAPVGAAVGPHSPNATHSVDAVERAEPLFHLMNGDLSYANVSDAPVETWASFFANVTRSASNRPWMPCAGNHENENGNGPDGYLAYQTRFFLPDNGAGTDHIGNWYAFTVGSVRVISLNGDDVCLQDGGFSQHRQDHVPRDRRPSSYIRGYSGGAQRKWLEATLAAAREDPAVDWVVVCVHQVAMCSTPFNGADLGIRAELLPLFDRYGVDLVLNGHEHYYQRSHPVRGVVPGSSVLTPEVVQQAEWGVIDTTTGTVHLTIGVGGNPTFLAPSAFTEPPLGTVIAHVTPAGRGQARTAHKAQEPADWLAVRASHHPYGVTVFDVDPGLPGGTTRIFGVHYGATAGSSDYRPIDRFVLERPRADALAGVAAGGLQRRPPRHPGRR